ncbi:MAG: Swt1 family HEPN domain-containing protein [Pirellulales bacterium]
MATVNQKLSRALELLTGGLRPFVESELKAVYNDGWAAAACGSFRDIKKGSGDGDIQWDAHSLLTVMWDQWNRVFRHKLNQFDRSVISELREFRNRWAHQQKFDFDDTFRFIDSIQRVLRAVSAPEANVVASIKRELLRKEFSQLQEETDPEFSWSKEFRSLAVYLLCCLAIVAHITYFLGPSSWFLSLLIIFLFAYLMYQHFTTVARLVGPHECDSCGKIIYADDCPYCVTPAV